MNQKIQTLVHIAQEKMAGSRDPVHDTDHVKRMVMYAENFATKYNLTKEEQQALVLAAWWHDVSRTIGSGTSFVFLSLVDDLISALMLWWETVRYGLFGTVAGLAVRIILCKTLGTGALFTRIFIRKKHRILVNILKDADSLDVLNTDRVERVLRVAQDSWVHKNAYRFMIRWHIRVNHLTMKTRAAQEYIVEMMKRLLEWMKHSYVYMWHVYQFGRDWVQETVGRIEELFFQLQHLLALHPA